MSRVEVQIQRVATFFYDVSEADGYYRHVGGGRWIPEEEWRAGEYECADMAAVERIADDMIEDLLGRDCVEESCTDPMQPWVKVRLDDAKYPPGRIAAAIEAIVAHLVAGRPVAADREPYTVNRGTGDYHDPARVVPDFPPIPEARAALLGRKVVPTRKAKQ